MGASQAAKIQKSFEAVEVRGNTDERLTNLPTNALLADGAILATHGTPGSPWNSLLWRWDGESFIHRSEQEIASRLAEYSEPQVILVRHMHRENIR